MLSTSETLKVVDLLEGVRLLADESLVARDYALIEARLETWWNQWHAMLTDGGGAATGSGFTGLRALSAELYEQADASSNRMTAAIDMRTGEYIFDSRQEHQAVLMIQHRVGSYEEAHLIHGRDIGDACWRACGRASIAGALLRLFEEYGVLGTWANLCERFQIERTPVSRDQHGERTLEYLEAVADLVARDNFPSGEHYFEAVADLSPTESGDLVSGKAARIHFQRVGLVVKREPYEASRERLEAEARKIYGGRPPRDADAVLHAGRPANVFSMPKRREASNG